MIAAGPNDVFEGRMNLTALYKEQIYMGKKKKKKEKKAGKKKKKGTATSVQQIFALCTNTSTSPGIILSILCKSIHWKKKCHDMDLVVCIFVFFIKST